MSSDLFLEGRAVVVTGGSRGIGAAIAAALAARGARVAILGRDRAALEAVATSTGALPLTCDVTHADAVRTAFAQARERHGDPYILVNNAGQAESAPFLDTTRELWERMLAANLTSAFLCTQEVLAAMQARGEGRIVNIASTSALRGYRNVGAYTAAKAGLIGLTRALAAETVRQGITVNAVCPAYTDTDMAARAAKSVQASFDKTAAEAGAMIAKTVQRGRLLEPREIASAVVWLCSPDATGITGQALPIAGGEI